MRSARNKQFLSKSNKRQSFRSLADLRPDQVEPSIHQYIEIFEAGSEHSKHHYQQYVDQYYNLVTDFYRFGWGQSFHFAPRQKGESVEAAMLRHQHFLADKLSLKPGMQVLDVGCGVGGPMHALAQYCGASFIGITINAYQIKCAKVNTQDVHSRCQFIQGDFMQIPTAADCFDSAYALESIVHAPNRAKAFQEVFRVLKPGGCFAGYEWCMTDLFDSGNAKHIRIKKQIEMGDALSGIGHTSEVRDGLLAAGFELLEARDCALEAHLDIPWYRALQGRDFKLRSIPRSPAGRALTNIVVRVGERLRLFPKGTALVSTVLNMAADTLVEGGKSGIFTPAYFFLARKPEN